MQSTLHTIGSKTGFFSPLVVANKECIICGVTLCWLVAHSGTLTPLTPITRLWREKEWQELEGEGGNGFPGQARR